MEATQLKEKKVPILTTISVFFFTSLTVHRVRGVVNAEGLCVFTRDNKKKWTILFFGREKVEKPLNFLENEW